MNLNLFVSFGLHYESPGFTLPVYMSKHTDRIISFSSDCFFCFILTEAQCTAVNMLLCFRSHWPHPLSFLVALSAAAIFRFVVPPWSFQDLHPPNLNSRSYRLSFRCNFSAFCLLRFSTFGFTGYTFCDAGFLLDPVFLSSSFTNANDQIQLRNIARKRFPALLTSGFSFLCRTVSILWNFFEFPFSTSRSLGFLFSV